MDMAISIRTIFNKIRNTLPKLCGELLQIQTDKEFLETENKMKGVLSTINLAKIIGGN
jgi:anthranilate/para-aminobenzoate synthase component I